ncbi:BTAD domain-containing putative transcriptional regulator [Streptomyces xanthochromogenes]|uniref:BTAD domain-containing putative transcriptional regulator n=1 Tax=Streptomyces xanthochromogenes TaxID=67384 RepID=UPI0037F6A84D
MEVDGSDGPVNLGGTKQRATLGLLLLQANKVVATSQLLNALWGADDAPTTSRKILQNAVYGLRGVLSSGSRRNGGPDQHEATLLTQPPGYMMRVAPEQVDLHRFHAWVGEGREKLAQGASEPAASLLHDALGLWRGPALADLVEAGIEWPELVAVQKARLDVLEDYFDAQLACNRHHVVLADLEMMVETEPLRERSCGQLMLALYRCGRQADALNVYSRIRTALVEDLGLEPGRGLQQLQQAILTQDPELCLPAPGAGRPFTTADGSAATERRPAVLSVAPVGGAVNAEALGTHAAEPTVRTLTSETVTGRTPVGEVVTGRAPVGEVVAAVASTGGASASERPPGGSPADDPSADEAAARQPSVTRHQVSALSIRTWLAPTLGGADSAELDQLLNGTASVVRKQVERFGGTVTASIGSVTLALFGLSGPRADGDDDARQAVLAALAIRDVLDASDGSGPAVAELTVQTAVTRGGVLVSRRDHADAPTVVGAVLDESQALLSSVPAGAVLVSDAVRRTAGDAVVCRPADVGWQVLGVREAHGGPGPTGDTEGSCELDVLRGLMKRTQRRAAPYLVTVLGESGTGKSRLLGDFEHWVTGRSEAPVVLIGRTPAATQDDPLAAQAQILSAYCGLRPGDDEATVRAALSDRVRSLFSTDADRVLSSLLALLDTGAEALLRVVCPEDVLGAWCEFFRAAVRTEPIVLCIDDLHHATDFVLDAIEGLAESAGPCPLFVVACAGPELVLRKPNWTGGKRHATTVTLDQPVRVSSERLVEFLLSAANG